MSVNWDYFDKFDDTIEKYLPDMGEGTTLATQVVTAVNKLIYKWYNDGDVYDNTHYLKGWANDISSYANWLYDNTKASRILNGIAECHSEGDYTDLLKDLADCVLDPEYLYDLDDKATVGSIYDCNGPFSFDEYYDD